MAEPASARALAYVRVSSAEQEDGASISAQRRAIEQYAQMKGLTVVRYIEEADSASVKGRRQFADLLRRLKRGQADTAIFHKLDRSTRNWHDWAKLTELMDNGTALHFVADGMDSSTPAGRMTLDMMAAMATHFSRNLSTESKKGLRERLKQGLFPWPAPLGYLDASMLDATGSIRDNRGRKRHPKAGVKIVDEGRAPLVRRAFEMSADGWSIRRLVDELPKMGLTTREGRPLSKSQVNRMLHNCFYAGRIQVGDEHYEGIHRAIISEDLFQRVQDKLSGKVPYQRTPSRKKKPFRLRGLIACASCGKNLLPEQQKGKYVYYRCHTSACPERTLPEKEALAVLREDLKRLQLNVVEQREMRRILREFTASRRDEEKIRRTDNALKRADIAQRRDRLVEKYIEGVVEDDVFHRLKRQYDKELQERAETKKADVTKGVIERVESVLELPQKALTSLLQPTAENISKILKSVYSNFWGQARTLVIERKTAFRLLHDLRTVPSGTPAADSTRTRQRQEELVRELLREVQDDETYRFDSP